jgi:hypothetical protein
MAESMAAKMSTQTSNEPFPYNTPPWRRSYKATSPDGAIVAAIDKAFEHSMSNPTVGTLRTSDGMELTQCSPAFVWSDDSRFLAVPKWCRRFGIFLRQRLAIVDVVERAVFLSRFTHWLLLPTAFEGGKLEVLVSNPCGISWPWRDRPLTIAVPPDLATFTRLDGAYR